jgi:hypothetical protein
MFLVAVRDKIISLYFAVMYSQHQEICAGNQSRFEDTGAHSEENSMEMTAVVPVQTATGKILR